MSASTIEAHASAAAPVAVDPSAQQHDQTEALVRSLQRFLDGAGRSLLRPGARTATLGTGADRAAQLLQARGFDAVAQDEAACGALGPRFDCVAVLGTAAVQDAFTLVKKHGLVVVLGATAENAPASVEGAPPPLRCPRSGALCYSGQPRSRTPV